MANGINLDDIFPLLLQKKAERRKENLRRQRVSEMTEDYIMLQSGADPTKVRAGMSLASRGFNVPHSYLQADVEPIAWDSLYEQFKVPEHVRELHRTGVLKDEEFARALLRMGDTSQPTDEMYNLMLSIPEINAKFQTKEQLQAVFAFRKQAGADMLSMLFKQGTPEADDQIRTKLFSEINSGRYRSMADVKTAEEREWILDHFKTETSRAALFNDRYDPVKLDQIGRKVLRTQLQTIIGTGPIGTIIFSNWALGKEVKPYQADFLNDNYNKDGTEKDEAIMEIALKTVARQERIKVKLQKHPQAHTLSRQAQAVLDYAMTANLTAEQVKGDWGEESKAGRQPFSEEMLKIILEILGDAD